MMPEFIPVGDWFDPKCCFKVVEENGEVELFIEFEVRRIDKRGRPSSPQARTWVSLEPGIEVLDDGPNKLAIYFNGTAINTQKGRRTNCPATFTPREELTND